MTPATNPEEHFQARARHYAALYRTYDDIAAERSDEEILRRALEEAKTSNIAQLRLLIASIPAGSF